MAFENKRARSLRIAYIGGGSRGWAWGFMKDLAMDGDMEGEVRLYDIDQEAAKRNEIIGGRISAHPNALSRWKYNTTSSLKDALTGADQLRGRDQAGEPTTDHDRVGVKL